VAHAAAILAAQAISFTFLGPSASTGVQVFGTGWTAAPSASLGVFQAAGRPSDSLSTAARPGRRLVAIARAMGRTSGRLDPGRVQLRRARLLATGIGPAGARLYAAPTTRGWVCYAVASPLLAFNCLPRLDHGLYLEVVDRDGPGGRAPYVFGLADDSVAALRLQVGTRLQDARLGRNAFTYTFPRSERRAQSLRAVVVTRRDGSTDRFTLKWPG
jgi:hypothetical protein